MEHVELARIDKNRDANQRQERIAKNMALRPILPFAFRELKSTFGSSTRAETFERFRPFAAEISGGAGRAFSHSTFPSADTRRVTTRTYCTIDRGTRASFSLNVAGNIR